MVYTVSQLAELLKITKQTVYMKMKLKEVEKYITKRQGISYIDEKGLSIIQDNLRLKVHESDNTKINKDDTLKEVATDSEAFKFNEDYINYLKEQLTIKDNIIKEKDALLKEQLIKSNAQLDKSQELTKNSQILQLKSTQSEEKYRELTEKMREDPIIKKSFMDRLFKK